MKKLQISAELLVSSQGWENESRSSVPPTEEESYKHPTLVAESSKWLSPGREGQLRLTHKKTLVHLQMEYYTAERKKEFLPFATAWMELESIMLSEISQVVKDKYHMISPISGN